MGTQEYVQGNVRTRIDEPKQFNVVMHNDDFTTMEFVVEILIDIFRKSPQEAEQLMLYVHEKGKAVVGTYPYDIAVTKSGIAMRRAKAEGFPFRVTVEEC